MINGQEKAKILQDYTTATNFLVQMIYKCSREKKNVQAQVATLLELKLPVIKKMDTESINTTLTDLNKFYEILQQTTNKVNELIEDITQVLSKHIPSYWS